MAATVSKGSKGASRGDADDGKSPVPLSDVPVHHWVFEPVDATALAVFRLMWGVIMLFEVYTFMQGGEMKLIHQFLVPRIQFHYWAFGWVVVPPLNVLKVLMGVMGLSAVGTLVGFYYRTSAWTFFFTFTYMYLMDKSLYLNHFYACSVICLMCCFVPAARRYSVDAWLDPEGSYGRTVPRWSVLVPRFMLLVLYFFAGVAKVNADWLRAEPLLHWLPRRLDVPILGPFLSTDFAAYFMSCVRAFLGGGECCAWFSPFNIIRYSGMVYDLVVGFMLCFDATFPLALASTVFFHAMNKIIMNIGIFPWMGLATTTLFFAADWPRHVVALVRDEPDPEPYPEVVNPPERRRRLRHGLTLREKIILAGILTFCAWQGLMPLRHHMYPGDCAWNEYGHMYSWRMKLRDKECLAEIWLQDPADPARNMTVESGRFVTGRQYNKLLARPDMLHELSHWLADYYTQEGWAGEGVRPEVHAEVWCSLNYRHPQMYIDPQYDLAAHPQFEWPYPFVTELEPMSELEKKQYPWNMLADYLSGERSFSELFESQPEGKPLLEVLAADGTVVGRTIKG